MKSRTICLLVLGMSACTIDTQHLGGQWKAVAYYENGHTAAARLDEVDLTLNENGQYHFRSMGQYEEAGTYSSSLHYLFFSDTTRTPTLKHTVKVLYLTADSLKLQLRNDSLNQVLFLAKTN